jgi:uncharacterized membrane protein
MELVFEEEGISQKKISLETCIPKATLSRTIASLKQKNLIRVIQDGYTKRLYLSDEIEKKN